MPDRFDKFTGPARHVLTLANEEAQRFNHNYIGTEHILLGLLREGDVAGRVLTDLGVDLAAARRAVEFKIGGIAAISMGEIGLTPRAKKVIEYAVDEARRLNHYYMGTEHLLLGLLREGEGIAAQVLAELGVGLAQVRASVLEAVERPAAPGYVAGEPVAVALSEAGAPAVRDVPHFEGFTEQARRVLLLAQEEARRFNHHYVGTEHLLLGLVRDGDGVAARVLSGLGVQLREVRSAVEFIIGRGERQATGEMGLIARSRRALDLAHDEARRLNHHSIGTEHLLLGLIREGSGIAAGVLESLGVSLDRARTQVLRVIGPARGAYGHVVSEPLAVSPPVTAPLLRDLVGVLPVARTHERGGVAVTLLALELYANGFVATFRLVEDRPAESRPPPPALSLAVADDRGNRLGALLYGATGRASEGHYEWRCAYRCIPALDRAARTLRLDLALGRWQEGATASAADEADTVWSFTVALPAGDAGAPTTEGGTDA
ncbi:MAG TPA: Clp protease N-terminal domain-containing protein [Thermomicrobiales bacterium]|nr:Clp protease N-terminal domain-containing protein [Thermomicrobiales bacterium]